ncbi:MULTISPECIES: TetR/AcrR family transcriptional regulator [unclassified Microbacterium]|uniref:TetR/AcrR family transcriptional regulator n=1 Tax=unclassified Microbacterium TaxID=2609290 RepID=UPI000EAA78F1|nr:MULTISPECIES: TetR/AcrR family transcriptional regulator [unclassified Microbacterium]MBT2484132.1 TetR/AcrR family transcriptional regulator [Microbacterium sp. ISL-108]RKN67078.1 TetR/AcrR family transcriptional regulator [Microbacterium sp. CGR2]
MTTRPIRRDAVQNRAGILSAARTTLASDPFASVDVIARSAGLSRRTLYGHFIDRDALIRELISSGAQRFNAIAASVDDADSRIALARLTALLWQEASHVQVAAALALDEAHVEHTADALAPLRRTVATLARRGQDDGSFRTDLAAPTLARLIEEMARTVVARTDAASTGASNLAVRTVLSIAGLSWRETDELLAAHPDIVAPDAAQGASE